MNGYVQVNQTLIIGWSLMGSNPLSQWTLMNIYNHKNKNREQKSIFDWSDFGAFKQ